MQEDLIPTPPSKKSPIKRFLTLLFKIAITILCFVYIVHKIDFTASLSALTHAKPIYLLPALFLFLLSKLLSAYRLNIYFDNISMKLNPMANIRLYWLGMFYNLFLPGAISGDAYKVVLLNRRFQLPYKLGSSAVFLDRVSGVLALGIIGSLFGIITIRQQWIDLLLSAGSLAAIIVFYLVIKKLFPKFSKGFWATFVWGLGVQLCQVISIYFMLFSLGISTGESQWVFIFLTSAVISILPISLGGGLGTRELVFAEGAGFFHLNPATGVTISLLFYLITLIGSLPGAWFVFHTPLKRSDGSFQTDHHSEPEPHLQIKKGL